MLDFACVEVRDEIPAISVPELPVCLAGMRTNRRADSEGSVLDDSEGSVLEMFRHGSLDLHGFAYSMLADGRLEPHWQQTTFEMTPKSGDLANVSVVDDHMQNFQYGPPPFETPLGPQTPLINLDFVPCWEWNTCVNCFFLKV